MITGLVSGNIIVCVRFEISLVNSKLLDLFMNYNNMRNEKKFEECLRTAVCVDDTDAVQKLLNLGVNVNARDANGWTPLHWACKKGFIDTAALLLKNGADKRIKSELEEEPAHVCSNIQICHMLEMRTDTEEVLNESMVPNVMPQYIKNDYVHGTVNSGTSRVRNNGLYEDELVLKIRVADAPDPDFIEIELPQSDLTFQYLAQLCCQELNVDPNQVVKLRKLPNTTLRKDKDIQRLRNFQEIEVVTNAVNTYKYMQNTNGILNNMSTIPANGYQSISKKDQTILY